ncbi:MAG: hypothetical protein GY746_14285 [Gammaproteobacteria bacterium]|nr:hypothetical protein [Gammaproteobacteria bacterium]
MTWTDPDSISTASVFELHGDTVRLDTNVVDISAADFVFGSPQLDYDGDTDHDNRMFFDKEKAAFRVGSATGTNWDTDSLGTNSVAFGYNTKATGNYSTAMGYGSGATGRYSTAMGYRTDVTGDYSTVMGTYTDAESAYETAIGRWNTDYTPNSTTGWHAADRLFVIGNGTGPGASTSDAMVLLKNGNTGFGTSTPDTTMHIVGGLRYEDGNQAAGYIPVSDANGLMTWTDPASVTTANIFANTSGVTSNENGTYASDDFVFGSPQLDDDENTAHDSRMFFDKDKSAFRVGRVTGTYWDTDSLGNYSVAFGVNTKATGLFSTAMGRWTEATGALSTAMGDYTEARSGYETALGRYNTDYTPNSTTGWDAADRLFVIGNGTYSNATSDAMVVLKNGNTGFGTSTPDTTMHIVGGLKYEDNNEGVGKVLTSDADGLASWQASVGDNLGNHTATQNINLNGNYLSGDGNDGGLYVAANGNVAFGELPFGTPNPTEAMEVFGNAQLTASNPEFLFQGKVDPLDTRFAAIKTTLVGGVHAPPYKAADQKMSFHVSNNSSTGMTRVMDLLGNGNVGIGITDPANKLSVSGNADFTGNVGIGTDSPADLLHVGSSTHTGAQSIALENDQNKWQHTIGSGGAYNLQDPSGTRLYVSTTGDVGIGTIIPTSALDVDGGNISLNGGWLSNDGGNEGISVEDDGRVVVGTGAVTLQNQFYVNSIASGDNHLPNKYVARLRNKSQLVTSDMGVLALQFLVDLNGYPGIGNWIQFFENETDLAGKIENNNNGDVQYQSGGSDYAELLERMDHDEEIKAGDIVGVFGGKISKNTTGADWVMAVSDQAVVLGNAVYDGTEENYEIVSFIGQIPVFVNGKVNIGDYILASGANDGTAIAVSPPDLLPEQGPMIVGRAWAAKETEEVARVNAVVGLPEAASTTMALARRVEAQQAEIDALKSQNRLLQTKVNEMDVLKAEMENIKTMLGMNNEIVKNK